MIIHTSLIMSECKKRYTGYSWEEFSLGILPGRRFPGSEVARVSSFPDMKYSGREFVRMHQTVLWKNKF